MHTARGERKTWGATYSDLFACRVFVTADCTQDNRGLDETQHKQVKIYVMTRLHDEGHLPTPPECSQDGYDNNAIIRSIPKPQTFLSNAPHFSAADIKFICANMRLYTIIIGISETEKSAPHFRACFTKRRVSRKTRSRYSFHLRKNKTI